VNTISAAEFGNKVQSSGITIIIIIIIIIIILYYARYRQHTSTQTQTAKNTKRHYKSKNAEQRTSSYH